jgi:hypothetical protein
MGLTLTYSADPMGTCTYLQVAQIVIIGYICPSGCTCSMSTACTCGSAAYFQNNLCIPCPANCTACTAAGCLTCASSFVMFGTGCR